MKFSEVEIDQTFLLVDSSRLDSINGFGPVRHVKTEECLMIGSKTANAVCTDGKGIYSHYVKPDEEVFAVSDVPISFPDIFTEFMNRNRDKHPRKVRQCLPARLAEDDEPGPSLDPNKFKDLSSLMD